MYPNRLNSAKHPLWRHWLGSPIARRQEMSLRSFYRDVLGGRQVWPTERRAGPGSLWFLVETTLVEVNPKHIGAFGTIDLPVHSPAAVAERCWDAGYTVRLEPAGADDELIVVDPLGRAISLRTATPS